MSGVFVAFGQEDEGSAPRGWTLDIFRAGDGYLEVVGIALEAGRALNSNDDATSPAVALIDERTAALYWPGQTAVGQRFRYSPYVPWITVVGVVSHVTTGSFTTQGGATQVYLPVRQSPLDASSRFVIRSTGDPADALARVREIARSTSPALMIEDAQIVSDMYDPAFVLPRFSLLLMSLLAALALLTSSIGLYGGLSYLVTQRTSEIGVRMALGASVSQVRRMVLREAFVPVVAGLGAGLLATFWLSGAIASLLYETPPHDPWTLVTVVLVLAAATAVAAYLPARRATTVDPLIALKAE
jgi:putative ABC transport system permease protein